MLFGRIIAALVLVAAICGQPAAAQNVFPTPSGPTTVGTVDMCLNSAGNAVPFGPTCAAPIPVTGTFTASLGGFTPSASGARGTPLTVTTSDSSGSLPTGAVVIVSNVGANPMYCNVNGVAATVADQPVTSGGGWFPFTIPSGITVLHCIATGSSTTANTLGGAGLATGTGGGSGGGGSGGTVTQGPGGASAWLVTGTGGTFPITAAALPLPALAATSTLQSTINTTLGSPMQNSGGTVGLAAGSAAVGTVNPTTAVNWGIGATGSAPPANAHLGGMTQGGNLVALTGTSNNLNVQCANCSGSGVSTADEAAFTAGTSLFAGSGGFYQTTATSNPLTTGQQGVFQMTANRALFTNLRNSSGTEIGTAGAPVQVSVANTAANGTAMLVTGTGGTFPMTLNTTPSLANGNGVVPTQGGSVLSATNGGYTNILQGNAVLATGNPLFAQLTAGSAVIGALTANQSVNTAEVNGITTLTGAGATGTGSQRVTVAQDTTTVSGSAPGTAGAASTNVLSVQGIASMTPLLANPGTAANWAIGATSSTIPANAQYMGMNVSGTGLVGLIGTSGGLSVNTAQVNGVTTLTGTGAVGTGAQRIAVGTDTATIAGSAPGTAGTASANVVTVQGVASMTPLLANPGTIGNWGLAASTQNGTTPTNAGLVMGQYNITPTTITAGNISPLQMDNAGNLLVNIKAGAGSGGTAIADGATFTIGTTSETPAACTYVSGGITVTSGKTSVLSCTSTASLHTTVDNTNANVGNNGDAVAVSSTAGSPVVNYNYGFNGTSWDRLQVDSNKYLKIDCVTGCSSLSGTSTTGNIAANNTTAVVVKASAGTLYGVQLAGLGSAPAYLKIYNATSATCGSGTPVKRLIIPAASTAANGAGSNISFGTEGVTFSTGITYCVTTGITDADTTAPAASTFLINIDWS